MHIDDGTGMHAGFTAPIGQVDGMVLSAGSGERSHKQDRQVQHKVSAAANEPMGNTAALSAGQSITSVSPTEGGAFFNVDAPAQDSALDTINLDAVKASTISSPGLSRFGAQVPLAVPSVQNLPVLSESVPVATNGWGDPYSAKIKLEVADAAQKHISDDLQCVPSGMADTAAGTTSNTMLGAPSATPARSAAPEFLLAGATSTTSDKPASSVPISFDSLGHENFKPPLVPVDSAGANPPPGGYSGSSVICAVKSNSVDVTCTGLAAPATALLENCDDRWNSGGVSFCVAKVSP